MDGSPPASMWMVRAAELFPKPILEKEDEKLTIPFSECKYILVKKNIDWEFWEFWTKKRTSGKTYTMDSRIPVEFLILLSSLIFFLLRKIVLKFLNWPSRCCWNFATKSVKIIQFSFFWYCGKKLLNLATPAALE
jgi:hypothetical protein